MLSYGKVKATRIKQTAGDTVFDAVITVILVLAFVVVAFPLIYIVSASFSSTHAVMSGRVWLWPVEPTIYAYQTLFRTNSILVGYKNSLLYTAVGTLFTLSVTMVSGFCLSRKDFFGRGVVSALLVFTMFFSGGLIPAYLLIKNLNMLNTIWALVVPGAVSAWFIVLARTHMQSNIPIDLYESAELDGCSVYRMFFTIALPLSTAIIAVITLYCAIGIWGSYFDAFLYITKKELQPLQVVLRNILILNNIDPEMMMDARELAARQGLSDLLKYAIIVVASAPLLILYPFVQKYFVKGIMIGSLKG